MSCIDFYDEIVFMLMDFREAMLSSSQTAGYRVSKCVLIYPLINGKIHAKDRTILWSEKCAR